MNPLFPRGVILVRTLPRRTIRPLAEELRVNRNTVIKAYDQLEKEGVIETVAGTGLASGERPHPFARIQAKLLQELFRTADLGPHFALSNICLRLKQSRFPDQIGSGRVLLLTTFPDCVRLDTALPIPVGSTLLRATAR